MTKSTAKQLAQIAASIAVTPQIIHYHVLKSMIGPDRACQAISQRAARRAGVIGEYLRASVLRKLLAHVGSNVVISFGSLFSKRSAEIADDVYIGAYCIFGDVRIGAKTLIADRVSIPSGAHQHNIDSLATPIRDSGGEFVVVHIGCDCWIGAGSVILADIGDHCIVAAGSVVTKPIADYAIVAGVPARVIGDRRTPNASVPNE